MEGGHLLANERLFFFSSTISPCSGHSLFLLLFAEREKENTEPMIAEQRKNCSHDATMTMMMMMMIGLFSLLWGFAVSLTLNICGCFCHFIKKLLSLHTENIIGQRIESLVSLLLSVCPPPRSITIGC